MSRGYISKILAKHGGDLGKAIDAVNQKEDADETKSNDARSLDECSPTSGDCDGVETTDMAMKRLFPEMSWGYIAKILAKHGGDLGKAIDAVNQEETSDETTVAGPPAPPTPDRKPPQPVISAEQRRLSHG